MGVEAAKCVLDFIAFSALNNRQIQDIFDAVLIEKMCNLPIDFILEQKGQNLVFPALIGITLNHEKNLNVLKSLMNVKHLQLYLKKKKKAENKQFFSKISSKMLSNAVLFYSV